MFTLSKIWEVFIQNFHLSIFILFVLNNFVFNDNQVELTSLDWIIGDGYNEAILKVTFRGKTLVVPLQKAPFCRLTVTHKCDCFVLRRDQNASNWEVGSFVYCGGRVHGEFMNSADYFLVAPSKDKKSQQHLVTKLGPPTDFTEGTDFDWTSEVVRPNQEDDFHYFKPLPEYYDLNDNATGYVKCFFVVDQRVIDNLTEDNIDIFLQNLVNKGNHYYSRFDILIIYYGWALALPNYTTNAVAIDYFLDIGYRSYEKRKEYHSIALLTPTMYGKSAVGIASEGSMCRLNGYSIYIIYYPKRDNITTRNQITTFIHEMGHQFGLKHIDHTECEGKMPKSVLWIMKNKTTWDPGTLTWSPCSIAQMEKSRKQFFCLQLKVSPYQPFCGDGLVQKGEECDCISEKCQQCCDKRCHLTEGSKCSNGPCCDVSTCNYITGIQCRAAPDSCDIPELCDGKSGECPPNYVVSNGYKCGPEHSSERGYCFNGRCGRHQDMCSWLLKEGKVLKDECYNGNLKGRTRDGGCGPLFPETRSTMVKCAEKDKFCGKIWCTSELGVTPEFYQFIADKVFSEVKWKNCTSLIIKKPLRIKMDPTFVQDGSDCGVGKMCIKQACVPLPPGCPKNCSGERITHPYTGEEFPAFILEDPSDSDTDGNGNWMSTFWYIIIIIILLLVIPLITVIVMVNINRKKKAQA